MELKENITIGALLGRTTHKMRLLHDKVFQKNNVDLNMEQFILLKFLECNDGANQQEISKIIDRDKTTITRLVSKMEKKSILLRVHSKEDKRVNNIYITALGKQVLNDILPYIKEVDNVLKQSISEEELSILKNVLGKFRIEIKAFEERL